MNTMLGDHQLTDEETHRLAEAAQAFHEARAKADREYGESSPSLAAWRRWNEENLGPSLIARQHIGIGLDPPALGKWTVDDGVDHHIGDAALPSPKRGIDLPTVLLVLFFVVVVVTVWVSVILDLRYFSGRH